MPSIIFTQNASEGLENCRSFLAAKNPLAMQRAASVIKHHIGQLEKAPFIGRPFDDSSDLRELIVPFGDSGYIALYRYVENSNSVYILAFRHQKEIGYYP